MPVEIKELVIRAVVHQTSESAGPLGPRVDAPERAGREPPVDQEAIVREAVKEVLRILKAAKER